MARPLKQGLDYFPFDVNFFSDDKIEPITGEFGIKGEIVVIKLLCAVYEKGYFAVWNKQLNMTIAKRCSVSYELVEQVVNRLVRWEFFDEALFYSDMILTSTAIQKRYQEATRKRQINYSKLSYWKLDCDCVINGGRNQPPAVLMAEENTQSKVNKKEKINKKENFIFEAFKEKRQKAFDEISNENKIILKKYGITKPIIRNTSRMDYQFVDVVEVLMEIINDEEWVYRVMQNLSLTKFQISEQMKEFIRLYVSNDGLVYDGNGFKSHFINWIKKML